MRVLIIEGEIVQAKEIGKFLYKEGFGCKIAYDGKTAIELLRKHGYDLLLLDLVLPDIQGLELMKRALLIRKNLGVILLSPNNSPEAKAEGLNQGADDYLTKPFSFLELKSRILAVMRRKNNLSGNILKLENIEIDLDGRKVICNENDIPLTRKEFDILVFLFLNKNKVVSRMHLAESIWGEVMEEDYNSNFLDVHVKNLRKKLAPYIGENILETVRGVGFRLKELNLAS